MNLMAVRHFEGTSIGAALAKAFAVQEHQQQQPPQHRVLMQ